MNVNITIIHPDPTQFPEEIHVLGAVGIRVPDGPIEEVVASRDVFSSVTLAREVIQELWSEFLRTEPETDLLFVDFLLAKDSRFRRVPAAAICAVGVAES